MTIITNKSKLFRINIIWSIILVLIIIVSLSGFLYLTRDTNPIPTEIRNKLTFSPFIIPTSTKEYTTSNYTFDAIEDNTKTLHYLVNVSDNNIYISEYIQPPEFTEIPEYKDRFLSNVIESYATIQTSNETIHLGRGKLNNNKQFGIMIEKSLLVWMYPEKEMNDTDWRQLGDQFEIRKISNK